MYYRPTLQVTLLLYVFTACFHVGVSQDTGSGQENNATISEPPHDLYFLTLGPYPDPILQPGWDEGPALIPAVRLAVEHINKRTDILEGFSLKLLEGDSGCNLESKSIVTYVKNVFYSEKQVVGIIGPACSAATLALAKIVSLNNVTSLIVQSPGASSPLLNNVKYFNTFRTIGSSLAYVDTFLAIIRLNNWTRIACLYDEERIYFRSTFSEFSKRASELSGLRVFSSAMYDGEDLQLFPVQEIRDEQVRVVFVFAGNQSCRRLLCIAYHMNVRFPTYQWIFHDRSKSQLIKEETFRYNGKEFSCNETIMELASHGAILNTQRTTREDNKVTVSGLNLSQYKEEYKQKRIEYENEIGLENITSEFANLYYDAAWSFALSLNSSIPILRENGFSLVNYTYGQPEATEIIRQEFFNVQFEGISGPIMFNNETRDSVTIIDISQLWKNDTTVEVIKLGYYYENITMTENQATFINDTFNKEQVKIHLGVGVTVIFATMLSTTFTALLQLANLVWYYKKSIKASSPNLSHLISSGCYLFAIAGLTYSIQETFNLPTSTNSVAYATLCNAFTWCLVLGYSLVFGTVCAKMWRVYRIFRHFRNESPGALISDNALIVFVIILLLLDMIVCTVWNVTDPWLLETRIDEHQGEMDVLPTISIYSSCSCKNLYVWLGILVTYKGIIALVVVALSIANRHIQRKEFKHARKVNMLVYSLVLIWGAGLPLYFILERFNLHIKFLIMCAMLNAAILLCCALLFLPPVIPVLKQNRNISKDFARKPSVMSFFSGEQHVS